MDLNLLLHDLCSHSYFSFSYYFFGLLEIRRPTLLVVNPALCPGKLLVQMHQQRPLPSDFGCVPSVGSINLRLEGRGSEVGSPPSGSPWVGCVLQQKAKDPVPDSCYLWGNIFSLSPPGLDLISSLETSC